MDVIGQYLPTKDQVQIRFMPNKTLVNKMLGSLNPNGRDLVIDGCDSIRRRVRSEVPGVAKKNLKELTDAGALDVMIDVLKLWMEDAPVSGRCDLRVLRCCGAFDATRLHERRRWVFSFSSLRPFGPRRDTAMLRA